MRAVVAMTVMHVLLFVLHVCVMWECEGARVTAKLEGDYINMYRRHIKLVWGLGEVWLR